MPRTHPEQRRPMTPDEAYCYAVRASNFVWFAVGVMAMAVVACYDARHPLAFGLIAAGGLLLAVFAAWFSFEVYNPERTWRDIKPPEWWGKNDISIWPPLSR